MTAFDVRLVNMPFANLHLPSLGLTQLRSALHRDLGDTVAVRLHYLNHDVARFLGLEVYRDIVSRGEHQNSGLGDWLFRQVAFPDAADNADDFFIRYYPAGDATTARFRELVIRARAAMPAHLDELVDRHELDRADVVGLTSMFAQNVACFALARRIKERNPKAVVVLGGANCEAPMGQELIRGVPQLDYVCSGPSLKSFPRLVQCLKAGDRAAAERIDGVFSRSNLGRVAAPGCSTVTLGPTVKAIGEELDIDVVLDLDYDSFLADVARNFPDGEVVPLLPFETSRGCWWGEKAHCTFCGLNSQGMRYRNMRPDNARALMGQLFADYGDTCRQWMCVDNIMPRSYVEEVFADLVAPSGSTIFYEVKADMTDGDLAVLARAGVTVLQPGIESLATSTLKLMRKGTTAHRNVQFLESCIRHDIYPVWNLLVGFPGEAEAVYQGYLELIPRLTHLRPPSGVYPVRFDRYSPYFDEADHYKLQLEPLDFYELTYPLDRKARDNLAYYFQDRNYEAQYFHGMVQWLDRLRRLVLRWQLSWYGRARSAHPRLHLDESRGNPIVFDSRTGRELEHAISAEEGATLRALKQPTRVDAELEPRLARLRAQGWIFEERGLAMSLVLPEPAPRPKHAGSPIAEFNLDVDASDVRLLLDHDIEPPSAEAPPLVARSRDGRGVSRSLLTRRKSEVSP